MKMPPTRIGRHEISTPNSFRQRLDVVEGEIGPGLEQSKKNSIMAAFPL